jgi:excisionase family DNA binding protein
VKRPTLQLAEVVGELVPSNDPVNDEAAQPPAADLVQWIDAIALAMAAGVRVGERGMLRGAAGATGRADASLAPGHDPEVMDADEVAAFLGVDRNTVYDYAGRGEIPHRRLGKRLLFSRSAIVAWLGSCKAASTRKG